MVKLLFCSNKMINDSSAMIDSSYISGSPLTKTNQCTDLITVISAEKPNLQFNE